MENFVNWYSKIHRKAESHSLLVITYISKLRRVILRSLHDFLYCIIPEYAIFTMLNHVLVIMKDITFLSKIRERS